MSRLLLILIAHLFPEEHKNKVLRQRLIVTQETRHTVMTDSPSASSPDTGSDSHQALALRKATDSDEPLPRHTFQFLYRSVDLL